MSHPSDARFLPKLGRGSPRPFFCFDSLVIFFL